VIDLLCLRGRPTRKVDSVIVSQVCLWPLAAVAGGTAVVAALRCVMLFIGLRLTLRGAPRDHRLPIYGEFARALGFASRREEHPSEAGRSGPAHHVTAPGPREYPTFTPSQNAPVTGGRRNGVRMT
jgi:hypothetical protein